MTFVAYFVYFPYFSYLFQGLSLKNESF